MRIRQSDLDAFLNVGAIDQAEHVEELRNELRGRWDDASAAVGDYARLAAALRSLSDVATRLATQLQRQQR